ncbi:hypothetical protein B0H65DRAFT_244899 [Neurospora tetraspora]|uniref:Uncharacterized protein n=1 Tax=Neurospora tetraspora TaxID=94610 RepID=A0AAE0MRC0_9PEZI|nr:hypothetical protein B0H65DRAFT_244899 [Neurospora tetraspora]
METMESSDIQYGTPIELAPKIIHRFYEPIMLLEALKEPVGKPSSAPPQPMRVDDENPKQLFQAFVYKLAHVCDWEKGGKTVTSIMVLDTTNVLTDEPEFTYVFGVNQATPHHLKRTASFLHTVLQKVASASPVSEAEARNAAERELRQIVLRFNRPRVRFYLKSLRDKAEVCLRQCLAEDKKEDREIAKGLQDLLESEDYTDTDMTPEAEYDQKCKNISHQLTTIFSSKRLKDILAARAAAGRTAMTGHTSMACWSDLVHTAQRILAYRGSVYYFFRARDGWPQLFQNNPRIVALPSGDLQDTPRRNKSMKAEGIVGRMTSNEKLMAIFKRFVQDLQILDLDTRLVDAYEKNTPLAVHSEVLLHHWLLTDRGKGEISPTMFFNSWPYIGSSKPTCKLCKYYFEESRSGVEVRPSHGNLYPKWRLPDVYDFHGPDAVKRRQIMLDRILQRVRTEVFNAIKMKSPLSYKPEDSNTWSATMHLDDRWTQNQTDAGTDAGTRAGTVADWAENASVIVHRADAEPAPGIINDVDSVKSDVLEVSVEDLRGCPPQEEVDEADVRTHTGMEQEEVDEADVRTHTGMEQDEEEEDDDDGGGAVL